MKFQHDHARKRRLTHRTALLLAAALSGLLPIAQTSVSSAATNPTLKPITLTAPMAGHQLKPFRSAWLPDFTIKTDASVNVFTDKFVVSVVLTKAPDGTTFSMGKAGNASLLFGYSDWLKVEKIAFVATIREARRMLETMKINAGNPGEIRMTVSITVDESSYVYDPIQSRYYQYVASPGITWTAALAEAATRTFRGRPGHLAVPSTEAENEFLSRNIEGATNVWIAATDKDNEGEFKWAAGDETGTTFWKARCSSATPGSADSCSGANNLVITPASGNSRAYSEYKSDVRGNLEVNRFSAWANNEPNNWMFTTDVDEEDYVATNWQGSFGEWNDLPNSTRNIGGYIVEYPNAPKKPFEGVVAATARFNIVEEKTPYNPQSMTVRQTAPGTYTVTWKAPSAFSNIRTAASSRRNFQNYAVMTENAHEAGCVVTSSTRNLRCTFRGISGTTRPVFRVVANYKRNPFSNLSIGQTTFGIGRLGKTPTYPSYLSFGVKVGQRIAIQKIVVEATGLRAGSQWTVKDINTGATVMSGTTNAQGAIERTTGPFLPAAMRERDFNKSRSSQNLQLNLSFNHVDSNGRSVSVPYTLVSTYGLARIIHGVSTAYDYSYQRKAGFLPAEILTATYPLNQ